MRNGNEKNSSSSSMLDCDVGLGLKMQVQPTTESYSSSCKRATMAFPYYNYPSSGTNANLTSFSGKSGGPTLNQVPDCGDDIYDAGGDGAVLPMASHNNSGFRPSAAGVYYGKAPFTAAQRQELERQRIIHKYMIASIPVPPQLLLPAVSTTSLAPVSQSPSPGLELRFPSSTGSDPEPWRCKRTDGKKWRCSRDVAPEQKYCERHAHKGKSRSRKLVEQQVSSHKSYTTTKYQRQTSPFPTMAASATTTTTTPYNNDQTRSIEWFMRGGGSSSNSTTVSQQWQQAFQTQSSSSTTTLDFSRDNTEHRNKNVSSVYNHQTYEDPYIPDTNFDNNLFLDLNADDKTTRHFMGAWEKEYIDGISHNHKSNKFSPSSSLSLSMYSNVFDEENGSNGYLGIGMMTSNNSVSWMNDSPPGGPLGEALCLGNAITRCNTNLSSPQRNSNTNSSSCSKSSCEDGSPALNFIG